MILEESSLVVQGLSDGFATLNVLLAPVNHRNVSGSQRDHSAGKNVNHIGSLVHQVDLRQHTDGSESLGVDLSGQLQPVTIRQVLVGSIDSQDDGIRLRYKLHDHVSDLFLDILWLVAHRHFRESRQVDQGQRQHVWRIDPQIDGHRADSGIFARLGLRLPHDLIPDIVEIVELLARQVQKLSPFFSVVLCLVSLRVCGLDVNQIACSTLAVAAPVDQLQNQRPSSHNARSSRKELAANNVLQHRALSRRLGPDNGYLRQINRRGRAGAKRRESVLELVDSLD
ncbi:hypothetical protein OGATHE_000038 [Ogataea polymorpha]|uniref:Uncharacterized protein n=1 Tax=Ogataea polymorpha TaxID=460523 RepID=A0A9P8THA6_9ASCO|nr:hypothetical protein OGATHE_000038 [Ogataea polymorpha]